MHVLFAKSFHFITEGKPVLESTFTFEARSFDINESTNEIYIGDNVINFCYFAIYFFLFYF